MRMSFASLRLKTPSLLFPHLSWSWPSDFRIFLCYKFSLSVYALVFRALLSLRSKFLQILHLSLLLVFSQKSFTLESLLLSLISLKSVRSSFNNIGSCCHLSSQNKLRFPSLISQKLFPWTELLLSQDLFQMCEPFLWHDILIRSWLC